MSFAPIFLSTYSLVISIMSLHRKDGVFMTKAEAFFAEMKNKKVALIGTGVSHIDLIGLLLKKNIDVTVCDKKSRAEMGELADKLEKGGAKLSLGENYQLT